MFVVTPRLSPANHFVSHISLTSPPVNDTGKYYRNTLLPVIDTDSTHTSDELIQCSLASDPRPTCSSGQGCLVDTSSLSRTRGGNTSGFTSTVLNNGCFEHYFNL